MNLLSTAVAVGFLFLAPRSAPVLVENMQLAFQNGSGTASAVKASFVIGTETWDFNNASFDVRDDAGTLVIERPLDNFSYRLEASFLRDVKSASAQGVWADYAPGKVIAKIQSARLEKGNDITTVSRADLNCRASQRSTHPVDSCIFAGRFTLASLGSEGVQRSVDVSGVDVSITKGKTTFQVKIGGIGKINGNGTTVHFPDSASVRIKVDKVKLGILDITGQFFSQLEDMESDNLKVERPFVTIIYSKGAE